MNEKRHSPFTRQGDQAMTAAERCERARLRSERWRRAHGIGPRRPAQKPWLALGVSRILPPARQSPPASRAGHAGSNFEPRRALRRRATSRAGRGRTAPGDRGRDHWRVSAAMGSLSLNFGFRPKAALRHCAEINYAPDEGPPCGGKKACYERLVFHRPSAQLRDRFPEPPAVFCEPIFCFGRHLLIHGALDQPVALQITQGLDQHFFGDSGDLALQLVEPPRLAERDAVEDDRCPFVTDQVEDAPSRKAEVIGAGVFCSRLCRPGVRHLRQGSLCGFLKVAMHEGDRHCALAHGRRNPLDRVATHVPGSERAWHACFKIEGRPFERPGFRRLTTLQQVRAGHQIADLIAHNRRVFCPIGVVSGNSMTWLCGYAG
jgi:hypothetical protein